MTKTEKRHNWLPSKRRRHDQRSDQSFAKIYGTRLFLDSRIVDHGPKTNPWEIRVWGGHRGWLKTNKLSYPSKDKSSQKAGKSSSSSDLASRWILMPRSKTFYLMPKNVAMESNMTSTDQLMENSLKLFKIWPDLKSEETGPSIHPKSSRDKINKYPHPKTVKF